MRPRGVTVAGNPAPIRVGQVRTDAIGEAPEFRYRYRGEWDAINSAYLGHRKSSVGSRISQDGAAGDAEYIYKDITLIESHVEFETEEVSRPWHYSPYYATLTASEIAFVQANVRGHLQFVEENNPTQAAASADLAARITAAGGSGSLSGQAIEDVLLNGDSYVAFLPHITYTVNLSPHTAVRLIIADIGKVYSTATLSAEIPELGSALFTAADILNTVTPNSAQTVGWLKRARMGYSSDGGAQYVQSYRFDAYPTNRYTFI